MNQTLKTFVDSTLAYITKAGLKLIIAIIVLTVGLKVAKIITKKIMSSKGILKFEISVRSFLNNLILITLDAIIVVSACLIIGIPATSFVALLGTAGVAIGLALQGAFSNFAGGIMILIFHPFKVGHYIETADISGTVDDISIFYTILKTVDNKTITIPNGTLMNSSVVNYSSMKTRRVDLSFSVSYDTDIELVKKLLLDTAKEHSLSLDTPEPFARLTSQNNNSYEFTLRVWCNSEDYWTLKLDLLEKINIEFKKNNITIPYQQIDVHLDK